MKNEKGPVVKTGPLIGYYLFLRFYEAAIQDRLVLAPEVGVTPSSELLNFLDDQSFDRLA